MNTSNAESFASLRAAITDLAPPSRIQASDTDREATAERIRRAFVEGRLGLDDFDTRTAAAWAGTTRADLEVLTADLPVPQPLPTAPYRGPDGSGRGLGLKVLRVLTMLWLVGSLVNFGIWTLVCLTTFSWHYPWWLWVVVPAGSALVAISWWLQPRRR